MSSAKVIIKSSDMPDSMFNLNKIEMQLEAISQAIQAYYNYSEIDESNPSETYKGIAMEIKNEFDKKYKQYWHVIVGNLFILNSNNR